jgi:hypothetical protein
MNDCELLPRYKVNCSPFVVELGIRGPMEAYPAGVVLRRLSREQLAPAIRLWHAERTTNWKRSGRTVRFQGVDEHIFVIMESQDDYQDWRVQVPAFRVNDEPDLLWVQDEGRPTRDDLDGMEFYLVPFNRWFARVDAKGKLR